MYCINWSHNSIYIYYTITCCIHYFCVIPYTYIYIYIYNMHSITTPFVYLRTAGLAPWQKPGAVRIARCVGTYHGAPYLVSIIIITIIIIIIYYYYLLPLLLYIIYNYYYCYYYC